MTAAILDDLLARKTVAGRPPDLADDLVWVRAAAGRDTHPDPRLPLSGFLLSKSVRLEIEAELIRK